MSTKKRYNGEGSVYQREDGKWVAALHLGYVDDKRKRVVRYARTRSEASEKLREMQRQHEDGINLAERQTVGEFLDWWLEDIEPRLARNTYQSYARMVRIYLKPHLGTIQLTKLTPGHIQRMIRIAIRQSTAHNARFSVKVLKSALAVAFKREYVTRNVARQVDLPQVEPYEATHLTTEQAHQFLEAARESRFYHLYRVALSLGIRQGELIALTWDNVDLDQKTLKIKKSKTPAGRRRLILPEALIVVLKEQQQRIRLLQLAAGPCWHENNLVFPSTIGTPILRANLRQDFKQVLARAALPTTIRFHDLRHSCASFLFAQGVQPKVVSEILGHSSITITLNTYTHVLDEVQREALEKISRLLA